MNYLKSKRVLAGAIVLALSLHASASGADLIDFELTPGGVVPSDNAVLDTPYSIAGGTVRFYFDVNANNSYDAGDVNPFFEARGNMDADPQGFASTRNGGQDRPGNVGSTRLGDWFLRQPDGIGVLPGPFIIDYDVTQSIDGLSGEIWDIDGMANATEQWQVDVLDMDGEVVATQLSPLGINHANSSLDSRPWEFSFDQLTLLSGRVDRVRLTFVGSKIDAIGLSFNNFDALQAILPGDYDDNGAVEAADFVVWRDFVGQDFSLVNENPLATTPGVVDGEDYVYWSSHFGLMKSSGSANTSNNFAIPEPLSLSFAWPLAVWLTAARRTQRASAEEKGSERSINRSDLFSMKPYSTASQPSEEPSNAQAGNDDKNCQDGDRGRFRHR